MGLIRWCAIAILIGFVGFAHQHDPQLIPAYWQQLKTTFNNNKPIGY